jgi:hypothetical protein
MTNYTASGQDSTLQDPTVQDPAFVEAGSGGDVRRIAVRARSGALPGMLWLGGFHSDMQGIKALALDGWAAAHGRACVRFDYSGHGESIRRRVHRRHHRPVAGG